MKLIIQIPCYNEAGTLPEVIEDLPRSVEGFDTVEYLVIDDGSSDGTATKAQELGVHHILSLGTNHGLAKAFMRGVQHAIELGADVVVNTDGDHQYRGADIAKLVRPILQNQADLVIGCRPILHHPEFSWFKKLMQKAGSWIVSRLARVRVEDVTSGFRAYSRDTCLKLSLHTSFSHCVETIIQAGYLGLRVVSVPVEVNPKTRPSRLFRSIPEYLLRQGASMITMYVLYRPAEFFFVGGLPWLVAALFLNLRFAYLIFILKRNLVGRTHLASLIVMVVCAMIGFLLWALGIIGSLIMFHRRATEESLYLIRREKLQKVRTNERA